MAVAGAFGDNQIVKCNIGAVVNTAIISNRICSADSSVKHRNIKYKNRISKVSSYFSSAPNKHFKLIDSYSTLARRKNPCGTTRCILYFSCIKLTHVSPSNYKIENKTCIAIYMTTLFFPISSCYVAQ